MSKQIYNTETTSLFVEGTLWSGGKCRHEYALHVIGQPKREGVAPTNLAEIKAIAGDFAEIARAKLVTLRREVVETRTTKKLL